jgi:hypothetical protein
VITVRSRITPVNDADPNRKVGAMGRRGRPPSDNTERVETRVTAEAFDELSMLAEAAEVPRAELIRDLIYAALADLRRTETR